LLFVLVLYNNDVIGDVIVNWPEFGRLWVRAPGRSN
jgi:hypothetical protein